MQPKTSININSKYFIDKIENDIVQLARTLSIEHSIDIESAKLMARKITQNRLNQLLTDAEKEGITLIQTKTVEFIKADIKKDYAHNVYELLKTFDLI